MTKSLYSLFYCLFAFGNNPADKGATEIRDLPLSDYVTITVCVPESHADIVREAMGKAGAGRFGNYSFCSLTIKGIARFMPTENAQPHIGKVGVLETVIEERIETVCSKECLEAVVQAIKQAHPYEALVIDIYPIYKIGIKLP